MKLSFRVLSIVLLCFAMHLLQNCTIEKRLYRKGYSLSWRHKLKAETKGDFDREIAEKLDHKQDENFDIDTNEVETNISIEISYNSDSISIVDDEKASSVESMLETRANDDASVFVKETRNAYKQIRGYYAADHTYLIFVLVIIGLIILALYYAGKNLDDDNGNYAAGIGLIVFVIPVLLLIFVIGSLIFALF